MEREQKRSTLKQTCYRSFLLAVIPLVLVLMGAEGTVGYIIRGSAMETIGALQENIAAGISSELRAKSLRLSRFVYANGGFTAIQNETAFDYKKPGAQMLTGGVDLDAIAARSSDLEAAVEDFFRKFGCHPSAVLADRIYQTRRNKMFCTKLDIRLSGPPPGRRKASETDAKIKRQINRDACDRNAIEG